MRCPVCGRIPGAGAFQANYCLGFAMLDVIRRNPGLTTFELSKIGPLTYAQAVRAAEKLRANGWVRTEAEEREQGGTRYRYWAGDVPESVLEQHRQAVGVNA